MSTPWPSAPVRSFYGRYREVVIPYDSNGVIKLVIIDPGGDGNWVDDKFTIDLGVE